MYKTQGDTQVSRSREPWAMPAHQRPVVKAIRRIQPGSRARYAWSLALSFDNFFTEMFPWAHHFPEGCLAQRTGSRSEGRSSLKAKPVSSLELTFMYTPKIQGYRWEKKRYRKLEEVSGNWMGLEGFTDMEAWDRHGTKQFFHRGLSMEG